MILAYKDIRLFYGKRQVLGGITGGMEAEKIHAIIGPNGAGKSSFINALSGLNNYEGEVYYDLNNIAKQKYEELAEHRAYCEQKQSVAINFTVNELLSFGINASGYKGNKQEALTFIAEYCEIETFMEKRIHNLSGGEQQLVHFARAVAQVHPKLNSNQCMLFLDEPNSALDIKNTLFLYHKLMDLNEMGLTVVIIMHSLNDCLGFADEIVLMDKGSISIQGSTEEVFKNPIIDHVFGVDFIREYDGEGMKNLKPSLEKCKQYAHVR